MVAPGCGDGEADDVPGAALLGPSDPHAGTNTITTTTAAAARVRNVCEAVN
jgi:hypothetical protein